MVGSSLSSMMMVAELGTPTVTSTEEDGLERDTENCSVTSSVLSSLVVMVMQLVVARGWNTITPSTAS